NSADPGSPENCCCFRWGDYFISQRKKARAIADAVERNPTFLNFLRGIDVCRDEHGVPAWVVAPLFGVVRSKIDQVIREHRRTQFVDLPPLRTTVHVGEDFVHLTTGLRYMDEAFAHYPLRSGDRVGHGLALGVKPREWARKSTRLPMPREDRWF